MKTESPVSPVRQRPRDDTHGLLNNPNFDESPTTTIGKKGGSAAGRVLDEVVGHGQLLRLMATATRAAWPVRQIQGAIETGVKVY